jgi:hypothetical protein
MNEKISYVGIALVAVMILVSASASRAQSQSKGSESKTPAKEESASASARFVVGGAAFGLGMSHAEIYAQIEKSKGVKWMERDLDSAPTTELLKMDSWTLSYSQSSGMGSGRGTISLGFRSGKLIKLETKSYR